MKNAMAKSEKLVEMGKFLEGHILNPTQRETDALSNSVSIKKIKFKSKTTPTNVTPGPDGFPDEWQEKLIEKRQ